jgi:D-serine deaminase-like pyridoxal phosphate-dependent protein
MRRRSDSPRAIETIVAVGDLAGLRLRGLLSHAGHAYSADAPESLELIADREIAILRSLATQAGARGVALQEISVGSTPTARFIGRQQGVTEMRPGNYVFYDRTQAGLGATPPDGCAMSIVARVVSRPAPARVIFDAGSKTLTSDAARGFTSLLGHGLVYPSLDAADPDRSIVIERLSEEHSVARVTTECTLRPGDVVRIIPNHA